MFLFRLLCGSFLLVGLILLPAVLVTWFILVIVAAVRTSNGETFISYTCLWPGSAEGVHNLELTETKGLRSGSWEVTLTVEGQIVLQHQIEIEGDYDAWDPISQPQTDCK